MKKYCILLIITLGLLGSCKQDSSKSTAAKVESNGEVDFKDQVLPPQEKGSMNVTTGKSDYLNRIVEMESVRIEMEDLMYEINRNLKALEK